MNAAHIKKIAAGKIAEIETEELCVIFDMTELIDTQEVPVVRGWIMDELESRDAAAFDAWMEDYEASPSKYFN